MTDRSESPNRLPWPPMLFGGLGIIALWLHWVAPLPWPYGIAAMILAAIGFCLVCVSLALDVTAALAFRRHRTSILPNRGATALITGGPFALSRNPIYVANTLLVSGVGLLFGVAWLVMAALVAAYLTQKLAIEREEAHLAARFGKKWEDYAARTPRWLVFR